jgi:hypothetical protein
MIDTGRRTGVAVVISIATGLSTVVVVITLSKRHEFWVTELAELRTNLAVGTRVVDLVRSIARRARARVTLARHVDRLCVRGWI